ncbi:MAG: hypothetical protein MJ072_02155, partial [Clostridia bacterium]|nr:hypothetical protein [Clostridia bacterium]
MKKLIVAICSFAIAATMLGTSTFAWFSMNTKVSASGMQVKANVGGSLMIAACETTTTAVVAESSFENGFVTTSAATTLDPVSTVNGKDFYYTSTKNVTGSGAASSATYVKVTGDGASDSGFATAYGSEVRAYVDYAFQLKATNTSGSANYVNFTSVKLTYGGSTSSSEAFRVAIFVDDMGTTGTTAAKTPDTGSTLVTILSTNSA